MGKVKPIIAATFLLVLALSIPCVTRVAEFNQQDTIVGITPDGGGHDSSPGATLSQKDPDAGTDGDPNAAASPWPSIPPRWSFSSETFILDRIGTTDQSLVARSGLRWV